MNDPDEEDIPRGYKVADFGMDPEITTTITNMRNAE